MTTHPLRAGAGPPLPTLPGQAPRGYSAGPRRVPLPPGRRRHGLRTPALRPRRRRAARAPPCSPPRPELAAGGSQRRRGSGLRGGSVSGPARARRSSCSSHSRRRGSLAAEAAPAAARPRVILLRGLLSVLFGKTIFPPCQKHVAYISSVHTGRAEVQCLLFRVDGNHD